MIAEKYLAKHVLFCRTAGTVLEGASSDNCKPALATRQLGQQEAQHEMCGQAETVQCWSHSGVLGLVICGEEMRSAGATANLTQILRRLAESPSILAGSSTRVM